MSFKKLKTAAVIALGLSLLLMCAGLSVRRMRRDAPLDELYVDFRNGQPVGSSFQFMRPEHADQVKPEPAGLRMTVAPEGKQGLVAMSLNRKIEGDFEVTIGYELIHVDPPKGGWGAGVEIYIKAASPTRDFFGFNRIVLPDGRDVFWSGHMTQDKNGQRGLRRAEYVAANTRSGQMRVTRRGPKVMLSSADLGSQDFRQLFEWDFGTDNLEDLRFAANNGQTSNSGVDLWLHEIRFRRLPTTP